MLQEALQELVLVRSDTGALSSRGGFSSRLSHCHKDAAARRPLASVAQISDLHLKDIGEQHHGIAEEIGRRSPDVIVITGDSVDSSRALPVLEEFLSLLPYEIPKYAILGNWEHWGGVDVNRLSAAYERGNGALLVNQSVDHRTRTGTVQVSGLDDLIGGRPDLEAVLEEVSEPDLHLLLAHCPAHRDLLRSVSASVDLILSGHTHGGQVQIFGRAPLVPRGSGRYLEGWYDEVRPPMYVSRGVGTSVLPVRFGARPEMSFFESPGEAQASRQTSTAGHGEPPPLGVRAPGRKGRYQRSRGRESDRLV